MAEALFQPVQASKRAGDSAIASGSFKGQRSLEESFASMSVEKKLKLS
jgi:hypothetical protein